MKLGILGGTFDPPHIGHLILAQEAWVELQLDRVLFVPARQPPHKLPRECCDIRERVAMVERAIRDNAAFELSRVDADRPGPNYTVDLIKILAQQYPGADLFFIMGLDSLADLPKWSRPGELIQLCRLAVMNRPGYEVDMDALEEAIPGLRSRVIDLPKPRLEISSSELQSRVLLGRPLRYLVPDAVDAYIRERGLYQSNGNDEPLEGHHEPAR